MTVTRNFISSLEEWEPRRLLSVMGATGSGKTDLVLAYLRQRPHEINRTLLVSVDAVAVYRELDIGSAKPRAADRSDFRWAGLDLFSPADKVNLSDYVNAVAPEISRAQSQGDAIILVGGSHFYERALVVGQSPGRASDPTFQKSLETFSNVELLRRLLQRDERWGKRLHENDRYRLARYLDLVERQGFSYDELFASPKRHPDLAAVSETVDCLAMGVQVDLHRFRKKLEMRIRAMIAEGWIEEVQDLVEKYSSRAPALGSVGYKELADFLAGRTRFSEALEMIVTAHAQLAKKQRTWLRGLLGF